MNDDLTQALRRDVTDEQAWDSWFRGIYPRVYFIAYRQCRGDRHAAEDAVQLAFERFIETDAIDQVRSDDDAVAYVATTAKHLLVDALREERRRADESGAEYFEQPRAEIDDAIVMEQLQDRLNESEQEMLYMVRMGHSLQDIASTLGIGYSNARVRSYRLRQKLKKIVDAV